MKISDLSPFRKLWVRHWVLVWEWAKDQLSGIFNVHFGDAFELILMEKFFPSNIQTFHHIKEQFLQNKINIRIQMIGTYITG